MNSTKTLMTMAPSMAGAIGLRSARGAQPGFGAHRPGMAMAAVRRRPAMPALPGRGVEAIARSYGRPASAAVSPRVVLASRIAVPSRLVAPSHVAASHVVATRGVDDAWAAKKGYPAPRGGPA